MVFSVCCLFTEGMNGMCAEGMKRVGFQALMPQALDCVRQIVSAIDWLSDSGKGIKEYSGRAIAVRRSVRGLTIVLASGKSVCWRMSSALAACVMIMMVSIHPDMVQF